MESSTFGSFKGCKISDDGNTIIFLFEGGGVELPLHEAKKLLPSLHQSLALAEKNKNQQELSQVQAYTPQSLKLGLAGKNVLFQFDEKKPEERSYLLNESLYIGVFEQLSELIRHLKGGSQRVSH